MRSTTHTWQSGTKPGYVSTDLCERPACNGARLEDPSERGNTGVMRTVSLCAVLLAFGCSSATENKPLQGNGGAPNGSTVADSGGAVGVPWRTWYQGVLAIRARPRR
jgi:hypothetical protein